MVERAENTNLTSRQEEILNYLREELNSGNAPSYREIGEFLALNQQMV